MKIAIVYKSLTGNTKSIAEAVRDSLTEEVVYFGEPQENIEADLYFVGSWTDKGMCCKEIAEFLKTLENKKIAYFGTAGFGGSKEYYDALAKRVKDIVPDSNEMTESFFCQGKMPMRVRERYVSMMTEHPDDKQLEVSIKNFDEALSHPEQTDFDAVKEWARKISC